MRPLLVLAIFAIAPLALAQLDRPFERPGRIGDDDLKNFPADIETLKLRGSHGYGQDTVTDAGIPNLKRYAKLRILHLGALWLTDKACEPLASLESLEELHLDSNKITGTGLDHLSKLKNLKKLNLDFNPLNADAFATLAKFPALTHLLVRTQSTPANDSVLEHCSKLTSLVVLHLPENTAPITDRGVAHLARLKKLTNVEIRNAERVTDRGLAMICDMPSLEDLSLEGPRTVTSPFTPDGVKVLGKATNLKKLTVNYVPMSNVSIAALASLTKLENLMLWSVSSDEPNFEPLGQLRSLKVLRTNQKISRPALREIAKIETLSYIDEPMTEIGNQELAQLAKLPNLKRIILNSPNLTAESMASLAKMTSLRELYVTDKLPFTPEQWRNLGTSLPACKIARYYPPYTVFAKGEEP